MEGIILQGTSMESFYEAIAVIIEKQVEAGIRKAKTEDLQNKFLSPEETRKLFSPNVSLVTIHAWAKDGILQKHRIAGRTYFIYSEVVESVKALKKYKIDP
jgi:hypothetical protein